MRKLSKRLNNYKSGGASPSDNYGPQTPPTDRTSNPGPGSYHGGTTPEIKTRRTLQPVDPKEATLEAEVGETVVTNLNHQGIPEFYRIGGKRHSRGGTPLNLPPNSFIFSRDNKMKIKDPNLLKYFGKSSNGKKSYTPADLSKQYDLNKYREILANPNSDKLQRDTATLMIQNYNLKLGALALAQESVKGFDRGLPAIATPTLKRFKVDPKTLIEGVKPQNNEEQNQQVAQADMAQHEEEMMPKALFGRETQLESKMTTKNENNVWNQMWNNPDAMIGATNGLANIFNSGQGPEMSEVLSAPNVFTEGPVNLGDYQVNSVIGTPTGGGIDTTPIQDTGNVYSQSGQSMSFNRLGGNTLGKFWKGGEAGGEPILDDGEYLGTNNNVIYDAEGNITGFKRDGTWSSLPANKKEKEEAKESVKIETSNKSTKRQNIPADADPDTFFDPDAEGFDESLIEVGDYVKKEGRWHKVTKVKADPYKGESIESLNKGLKGESADLREDFGRLKYMIDNNEDVRTEVISRYREKMKTAKPSRFMTKSDIAVAEGLSDEAIIQNFLDSEMQVMAINANKGMIRGSEGEAAWDKTTITDRNSPYYGLPKSYVETAQALGFEPKTKGETYGFQTAYIELEKMAQDPKYKDILKDFTLSGDTQWGTGDETVDGVKNRTVSPADGWWGNTTTGQAAVYNPEGQDWGYEDIEDIEDPEEDVVIDGLDGVERDVPGGWTAPDTMQLGVDVKNRLGLKKYRPWAPKDIPQYFTPKFTSMEQPISRVNAQVMGALEGAGRLAQPGQAFAANASALGKTSANSIIDAGFKEQTFNTGIANQAEQYNIGVGNASNRTNNGLAKSLYDGNTIMNQAFDNSKRSLTQRIVTDYGRGWQNASNLQVMNTDNPNYNIDPWTGRKKFVPGTDKIEDNYQPGQDFTTLVNQYMESIPGMTPEIAAQYAFKTLNPKANVNSNFNSQDPYKQIPQQNTN
tara:strand:- start:24234 stop:27146 length:2913 start_codon:yes stop_codon:yes gene_type:complete